MKGKIRFLFYPRALKNGRLENNDQNPKIFSQIGPAFETRDESNSAECFFKDSDGYLKQIQRGDPRIKYDENGVPCISTLIQLENELNYTEDYSSDWTETNINLSRSEDVISPEGRTNAYLITNDSSGSAQRSLQQNTGAQVDANEYWQFSVWVKQYEQCENVMLRVRFTSDANESIYGFNFDSKTFTEETVAGTSYAEITNYEEYANGWYRLLVAGVNNGVSQSANCYVHLTKNGENSYVYTSDEAYHEGVYIYGPQFVFQGGDSGSDGVVPYDAFLPYIPSITGTEGRVFDHACGFKDYTEGLADLNVGGIWFIDAKCLQSDPFLNRSGGQNLSIVNNAGSTSYRLFFQFSTTTNNARFQYIDNGATLLNELFGPSEVGVGFVTDERHRYIVAWSATDNSFSIYVDGKLIVTDTLDATSISDPSTSNWGQVAFNTSYEKYTNPFGGDLYGMLIAEYDETLLNKLIAIG